MINSIEPDRASMLCEKMLLETSIRTRRVCSNKAVLIAIDKHLIPRYDKDNMMHLAYSKPKDGTCRFESYCTMQVVSESANATICCIRETRGSEDADFVREFAQNLKKCRIRARMILLDCGFYSVDVMNAIHESGNRFLMPAVKNSKIKQAIQAHHAGYRDATSRYTMENSEGNTATFTLLITPSNRHDDPEADIIEKYLRFYA